MTAVLTLRKRRVVRAPRREALRFDMAMAASAVSLSHINVVTNDLRSAFPDRTVQGGKLPVSIDKLASVQA